MAETTPTPETTETPDAPVVETPVDAAPAPAKAPVEKPAARPAPVDLPPPTSKPAPTPQPAPQRPAPTVTPTQPAAAPASSFSVQIENLKAKGSLSEKALIQALENYIEQMRPGKPVSENDGAHHQYTLWRVIHGLIHQIPPEEFPKHWNLLLSLFAQNQGEGQVFHDRYVFRFSEYWSRAEAELDGFQRVLNLIKLTADPQTRKLGLKQVSLDRTLSAGFTEDGRQKLLSFYA